MLGQFSDNLLFGLVSSLSSKRNADKETDVAIFGGKYSQASLEGINGFVEFCFSMSLDV